MKKEKKILHFKWVKRLTFELICPRCEEPMGCYSIDELLMNYKNGEECSNCGNPIAIAEENIQYSVVKTKRI